MIVLKFTHHYGTGSNSTHSASIQIRSFPSYSPPAINFSRIVDQTSIFNWTQGAPYMLNGNDIHASSLYHIGIMPSFPLAFV
jgi:hypothetical protein